MQAPVVDWHWNELAERRIADARTRLLSPDEFDVAEASRLLRPQVAAAWRRARLYALDPGKTPVLPRTAGIQIPPRLRRAALPVLEALVPELRRTVIGLADRNCRVVWRASSDSSLVRMLDRTVAWDEGSSFAEEVLANNGIGTAVELCAPLMVVGGEHYFEVLQGITSTAFPIRDPATRRLEGVLSLTCRVEDTHGALLPLIVSTGREIARRLMDESSRTERSLLDSFVQLSRTPAVAVVTMNDDVLIANSQAAELLEPADRGMLWAWASKGQSSEDRVMSELTLSGGTTVAARCSTVSDGTGVVGALVTLTPRKTPRNHKQMPVDGVTGVPVPRSGPVWDRVHRRALVATRRHRRLLLTGASGTGKAFLAESLADQLTEAGGVLTVDCGVDVDPCERKDLRSRVAAAMESQSAAVLLRRIDLLSPDAVDSLARLLKHSRQPLFLSCLAAEESRPSLLPLVNLAEAQIDVPRLGERIEDIPFLVPALIKSLCAERPTPRCREDVLTTLMDHEWPGDVRELRRLLASALLNSEGADIRIQDLPKSYLTFGGRGPGHALWRSEGTAILDALDRSGWNCAKAAADLGIAKATLYRKIKQMGIRRPATISGDG